MLSVFKILIVLIIPASSLLRLALSLNAIRPIRNSFPGIDSAMRMSNSETASSEVGDGSGAPSNTVGKEVGSQGKGFKKNIFTRSKNLLIIGLGNPGSEYDLTRHNIGFRAIDEFAASNKVVMKFTSKFNADYGAFRIGDKNVGLLKPSTYINNSGGPIKKIMENFKLSSKDILIIADDIALDCGDLRLREKGSHGGHNGHRDIEATLKTKEYSRLRVGISGPGRKPLVEHVLGEFSANEANLISAAVTQCSQIIEDWILVDEMQLVMNKFNGQIPSK